MNIVDKVLMILGKNDIIKSIKNNPENYLLRLESMSFIMVVRKEDNNYINVYSSQSELQSLVELLDKHPNMEG